MVYLTEPESRYYNDLFTLCDVEKTGKVSQLKVTELFRSSQISSETLSQIYQLSGVFPSALYLSRTQFYACLKLIGANQAAIPLREEVLTSDTLQIPLPKFSWKMELEPPPQIVAAPLKSAQNGFAATKSPDLIQLSSTKESLHLLTVERNVNSNSDLPSTDSEVEQTDNEREITTTKRSGMSSSGKHSKSTKRGSPETWSTASESPTPTNSTHNSVAERPWAVNSQSWQGLLCEEQRQLLGTEEESSDKHSSDEDEDDLDLEALYQITAEQKEYYLKQFRTVQPDLKGLLSGTVARVFFEKSRIPVEELRHIWQLCDVTRDGALDCAEFTAAMHLVVLRRNNIPIPSSLPTCLQPPFLHKALGLPEKIVPPEGDLLQLESDDNQSENVNNRRDDKNDYQRMVSSTYDELPSSKPSSLSTINKSSTLPKNHYSQHQRVVDGGGSGDNSNNNENIVNNKQPVTSKNVISSTINQRSNSNTPPSQVDGVVGSNSNNLNENQNSNKEWTKFAESPTSNLSSPGPKPVNFTTKIDPTASQVIHPVALRVTPVGMEIADDDAQRTFRGADNLVYESGIIRTISNNDNDKMRKPPAASSYQRDSLPNDLRAIQRPHPKKPASKNIGTIPLPPIDSNHVTNSVTTTTTTVMTSNKKEVPPLPPPRPHRHTRSSSLDLQRIKLTNNNNNVNNGNGTTQSKDPKDPPSSQPPELPPPRLEKTLKMASVDTGYIDGPREESFADFTQFPEQNKNVHGEFVTTIRLDSQPPVPQPRSNLSNTLLGSTASGSQRTSAFEVYRKPSSKSRNSQSPPQVPAAAEPKSVEYEKQVLAISDSLRQVRFKNSEQNAHDVLKHLKDQNVLLMRLCKDLSEELMGVQRKKEEFRGKIDQK